jgi:DNA polymerase-4
MRKIIHIDADSFYASVEIRENPALATRPVAVGGSPDKRGVIATCNYIARSFGVRSAMSSAKALQLCPDLVFVKPTFELYRTVSRQMQQIFREYTELIEPLSLDEAYLDVSACKQCQGSATRIAEEIRQKIRQQLQLTVSAGVANNKFLAKVASDWNKPDGIFVITPKQADEFVRLLPVTKINGVGKVTAKKMASLGIQTCGDLQTLNQASLTEHFGSYGLRLYELARGLDERPVQSNRVRKSQSVEHTFDNDLPSLDAVLDKSVDVYDELLRRYGKICDQYLVTKRFVKVKFADFSQTTMEESMGSYSRNWQSFADYTQLIESAWRRQGKPVRLLGMGVRLKEIKIDVSTPQLSLF